MRIVQIVPSAGAPDNMSYSELLLDVQAANEVFKVAGVQFWISSTERWVSAEFSDLTHVSNRSFGQVKGDLQMVFPGMPSTAWADGKSLRERVWLRVGATRYAKRDELIVWVPSVLGGSYQGFHPEWGSAAMIVAAGIPAYKFAHEVAHVMGVCHTHVGAGEWAPWQTNSPADKRLYDPATLTQVKPEHFWDLVYKPGTPNTFYSNQWTAAQDSASLGAIDRGDNCSILANGSMKCTVMPIGLPSTDYYTGDPALKGLAFTFPGSYGANAASYVALDNTTSHALSDSQRNDPANGNGYWRSCATSTSNPAGTACNHDGASPSPIQFGYRLATPLPGPDFDGNPATPELAYYSSIGYQSYGEWGWKTVSGSPTFRYLGGSGQVPLPGQYDYDWKTDIAVYNPTTATFWLARSQLD